MRWKPVISSRAIPVSGTHLHVMDSQAGLKVAHRILVPSGACPVSGNPITGLAVVSYTTKDFVIEIVSLREALLWATSSREETAPRNIEALAEWLHKQACTAAQVEVSVRLHLLIRPGPQIYSVTRDG